MVNGYIMGYWVESAQLRYLDWICMTPQSPLNVGILGSRIPRKVLESEEGFSVKS